MSIMWTAVLVAVLVALVIVLVKFLIWNCIVVHRDEDTRPILPSNTSRENFWIEYDRLRQQGIRARQPPPDFDEALRTSRPVSYIHIDEEPPPTYEDFLKSRSPSPSPDICCSSSSNNKLEPEVRESDGFTSSARGNLEFEDNFVDIDISNRTEFNDIEFTLSMADIQSSHLSSTSIV